MVTRTASDSIRFTAKDLENARILYCEMFQHFPQRVQNCHQFPNTEEHKTPPFANTAFRCSAANQIPPSNLGSRTGALRYHEVFFMTHELGLEPKQPQLLRLSLCNTTEVGRCGI